MPSFSNSLEASIHKALTLANNRKHELATLEHLLLALLTVVDASRVLTACDVNIEKLEKRYPNGFEKIRSENKARFDV